MRRHDGFYFRAALGLGGLIGSNRYASSAIAGSSSLEFDSSGLAIVSELAFGGSPAPGLVIGGGSYGASIGKTRYISDGIEVEDEASAVSVIGPFIDFYPDPEAGLHLQLAPGLGLISAVEGDFVAEDLGGLGFGFMAGVGYEFWISEQWSIGALARVLYANATLLNADGNERFDVQAIVPGLLFAVTYH